MPLFNRSDDMVLEILLQDRVFGLYGDDPNTYEEIGPTTGNSLQTLLKKLLDPDGIKQEFQVSFKLCRQNNDFMSNYSYTQMRMQVYILPADDPLI